MLSVLLEYTLWYVAFVHPLVMGTQLCRRAREGRSVDMRLVTNVTLAMVILWVLDIADVVLLSYLLSMRSLYLCLRILLSMYLIHPKLRGATKAYSHFFDAIVRYYAPVVDELVTRHLEELERTGVAQYLGKLYLCLVAVAADVLDIAKEFVVASTDTNLSPEKTEQRKTPLVGVERGAPMPRVSPKANDGFSRESSSLFGFIKSRKHTPNRWESPPPNADVGFCVSPRLSAEQVVYPAPRKRNPTD
ncbi:hypothetical protein DQ04_03921090 [Trypanosoma grayi]|uniref:hypothetical protein n=1 Tax=Trypanosoma grayi TaxID=71804 RepID=UPI0004F3F568|nr:hypothetical protein DQ04_03921090 [Trypanosoma grayi]KEG10299.1 hypothetical protein DQ04_03921090 [Trypanosoma grayi]